MDNNFQLRVQLFNMFFYIVEHAEYKISFENLL